jgi:hypothetical protein
VHQTRCVGDGIEREGEGLRGRRGRVGCAVLQDERPAVVIPDAVFGAVACFDDGFEEV